MKYATAFLITVWSDIGLILVGRQLLCKMKYVCVVVHAEPVWVQKALCLPICTVVFIHSHMKPRPTG
jgi:hypothetical protein